MRDFWIWLALSVPSAIIAYGVHQLMELYLKEVLVVAVAGGPGTAYLLWVLIRNARRRATEEAAALTVEQLYALRELEAKERAERRRDRAAFWNSEAGCVVVMAAMGLATGLGFFILLMAKMYFDNLP